MSAEKICPFDSLIPTYGTSDMEIISSFVFQQSVLILNRPKHLKGHIHYSLCTIFPILPPPSKGSSLPAKYEFQCCNAIKTSFQLQSLLLYHFYFYSLYTQAMLIQILINGQYLHVVFSFNFKVLKKLEWSKSFLVRFQPSNKTFFLAKFPMVLLPLYAIWKALLCHVKCKVKFLSWTHSSSAENINYFKIQYQQNALSFKYLIQYFLEVTYF